MLIRLLPSEAKEWFHQLPPSRQIGTLSPGYVMADAARDASLNPLFLGYREADSFWLHGVHCSEVPDTGYWDFQSPYGYGGPVTNCDDHAFLDRAWGAYAAWCKDNNILAEFVRLHPLANHWQPYGGEIALDRETVVIPLQVDDIRAGYSLMCRRAVRKGEKNGLRVEERPQEEICTCFAEFYRNRMREINAAPFYFFNNEYFTALASQSNITLLVCLNDTEWLSAVLFIRSGNVLEYHLSATTAAGRSLAATNLLIDAAAHNGRNLGINWLYLGGGTDGKDDNPLLFFKAGFASSRLSFSFGYKVYHTKYYKYLKEKYLHSGNECNRVLFYRIDTATEVSNDGLPLVILGAGGHAKVLLALIQALNLPIRGVCDPDLTLRDEYEWLGLPVIKQEDIYKNNITSNLVNGIGQTIGQNTRQDLYQKMRNLGYFFPPLVHPSAWVAPSVKLADGVQVMAGVVIQPDCIIGENSIINTRASVDHDSIIGANVHIAPGAILCGGVQVGDGAFIAAGATIGPAISIGARAIVGAGVTLVRDLPPDRVILGEKPRYG